MTDNKIRIIGITNALFFTIPILFVIYTFVFPLIYFMFMFITKDDGMMFFWGYWISEVFLLWLFSKIFFKIFKSVSQRAILIVSLISTLTFTSFAISVFPYRTHFPSRSSNDIVRMKARDIKYEISHSTNTHSPPDFYLNDKQLIEKSFINLKDSLLIKDIVGTESHMYQSVFGLSDKVELKNIVHITVDTIIYNQSYHKCYVGILFQLNNKKYYGNGFIGYKTNVGIKLCPFQYITATYPRTTKTRCQIDLRNNFFKEIRTVNQYVGGQLKFYDYSPLDIEFWDGVFFTKGLDVDSLYYFETKMDYEKKSRTRLAPYIHIRS